MSKFRLRENTYIIMRETKTPSSTMWLQHIDTKPHTKRDDDRVSRRPHSYINYHVAFTEPNMFTATVQQKQRHVQTRQKYLSTDQSVCIKCEVTP